MGERVIVPLVFTTTGGMAPEAKRFIRRLACLIAAKTKQDYSQVMCNIRTRLSMDLGNPSLGLYWLKGRVIAIIHAKTSTFCERFCGH